MAHKKIWTGKVSVQGWRRLVRSLKARRLTRNGRKEDIMNDNQRMTDPPALLIFIPCPVCGLPNEDYPE